MYGQTDGYIFNEKNVSGDRESVIIDATRANKISVVYKWTGNLAGDFEVWASNDDLGGMGIGFFETNIIFDTNPAGTAGIAEQEIDAPNKYYMIKFDHTVATAGNLYMSLATRFDRSLISKPIARFADASFTNTSPRYLSYGGVTEKFAGGVLATRRIGGKLCGQFEEAATSLLPYCDKFDEANWNTNELTLVDEAETTPHTDFDAWSLTPTAVSDVHTLYDPYNVDGSSQYVWSGIFKANGYNFVMLRLGEAGFVGSPFAYFNLSTGAVGNSSGVNSVGIEDMGGGWYRCYISALSNAAADGEPLIAVCDQDYNLYTPTSFSGDASSGVLCCQTQFETGYYPSSLIKTVASQVIRNKDVLYWDSSIVPDALRKTCKIIYIPYKASISGLRVFLNFVASGPSANTYLYASGSKAAVFQGSDVVSVTGISYNRYNIIELSINPDTGFLSISGVTGSGDNSGTPWSTSLGHVYVGCYFNTSYQSNGLLSEPY